MPQIYDMGPTALLPLRRKTCWGFFRPKNPTASAGFEPTNLGTKGQHATPRPPKHHIQNIEIFFSTTVTTSDLTWSLLCSVDQTEGTDTSSSWWRTVGAAPSTAEHNIAQPGNSTQVYGRETRGRRKCRCSAHIPLGPSMMTWDEGSLWYFHFVCWYFIVTDLETLLMLQLVWCDCGFSVVG